MKLAACLALLPLAASAQSVFTIENDAFFHTDRYYTNGVQFRQRVLLPQAPTWAAYFCASLGCSDAHIVSDERSIGQLMYTPSDIEIAEPQPFDRPWAGLLYVERSVGLMSAEGDALTTLSWEAGVTGRASLAEQSQKAIHRLIGRAEPRGWDNQIGQSLVALFSAERRIALPALNHDFGGVALRNTGYARAAFGNLMSYGAAGWEFTIGEGLPLMPSTPGGIRNTLLPDDAGGRLHLFGGVEARAVVYNVFLDGRLFGHDPHVPKRPLVGDAMLGLRYESGRWFIQFKATRRSPEFRSPMPVWVQSVGAISLGTLR